MSARQEFLAQAQASGASGLTLETLGAWFDRSTDDEQPALSALVAAVRAAPASMRDLALWTIATHLSEPGLDARARALLVERVLDRHLTVDEVAERAAALRATWASEEYAPLVATLGRDRFGTSLANAHTVFVHAWRAAPPEVRHGIEVIHRGEPLPEFGGRNYVHVAIRTARAVEHLAKGAQREQVATLISLGARALIVDDVQTIAEELRTIAARKVKPGVLSIARACVAEAHVWAGRTKVLGSALRPAVAKATTLLAEHDGAGAARAYLHALDDEIRRVDVLYALEQRNKTPSNDLARAVWRGGGDDGRPAIWCAELVDGRYGLLRKEGNRWQWTEGSREDIVALVPDAHFDAVTRAAGPTR